MEKRTHFIDIIIKSANELLEKTHGYVKWQAPLDMEYMSINDRAKVSHEVMRVAVRLSKIMGWLMLQKAILEGEILRGDLLPDKFLILQGKTCLENASETDPCLPRSLRELLKESRELYLRTMRLEEGSLKVPPPLEEIREKRVGGYHTVPCHDSKKNSTDSR